MPAVWARTRLDPDVEYLITRRSRRRFVPCPQWCYSALDVVRSQLLFRGGRGSSDASHRRGMPQGVISVQDSIVGKGLHELCIIEEYSSSAIEPLGSEVLARLKKKKKTDNPKQLKHKPSDLWLANKLWLALKRHEFWLSSAAILLPMHSQSPLGEPDMQNGRAYSADHNKD
jgi:hypothetical protein